MTHRDVLGLSIVSNRVSSVKRLFEIQKYEVQFLASPPLPFGVTVTHLVLVQVFKVRILGG